ncbi:MAG TPA: hypothetical protein VN345_15005, partial [Blastocatellia bacterium]|nr:hypothetical protein [Blastocatellia bacterium]
RLSPDHPSRDDQVETRTPLIRMPRYVGWFEAFEEVLDLSVAVPYRRSPVTTISVCRLPQREQTSFPRQSRTLVSAPYRAAISAGSGST